MCSRVIYINMFYVFFIITYSFDLFLALPYYVLPGNHHVYFILYKMV